MSFHFKFFLLLASLSITALTVTIQSAKHQHSHSHSQSNSLVRNFLSSNEDPISNAYKMLSSSYQMDSVILDVAYIGPDMNYLKPTSPHIRRLQVKIKFLSNEEFSIKIRDSSKSRWEVPESYPFANDSAHSTWRGKSTAYKVEWDFGPFALRISRPDTNEVIFNTSGSDFIYSNQYLEFSTVLPTENFYGLGERAYKFNYNQEGVFTIMNRDTPVCMENGTAGNGVYGSHPVMLFQEKSGRFDALLVRTTNSMDFVVGKNSQGQRKLTFKIAGGILDLRFFIGDKSPETAISLYHRYLGGWMMPPFWALGFHQCKWGYKSLSDLKNVVGNYSANDLPLDTIWSDIDYMVKYQDFTIDEARYNLGEMEKFLSETKLNFIPIIDAGIAVGDNKAAIEGAKQNVFIKSADGGDLWGKVWPGDVHFPDFFNPNATQYWVDMLSILYEKVKFTGLWIDMNEAANFCQGECPPGSDPTPSSKYTPDLPYTPGGLGLDVKSMSPSAVHHGNITEFDVHNTFGYLETIATNVFMKTVAKTRFPFIVSRSTLWGQGKYGTHWTGDNFSSWPWLRVSIPHLMNFNLFGVPVIGADICGFDGNTTVELCARWMQLGSLYPLSRNHNIFNGIAQEPYALGNLVQDTSRLTLKQRYALLKYYYMLFAKQRGTGTVFRPLFFEFPEDTNCYNEKIMNEQFLLGSDLMAVPILYEQETSTMAYFPKGAWYNLVTGEAVQQQEDLAGKRSVSNVLPAPVSLFLREGAVIYMQETKNVTRSGQLGNNFKLIAAIEKTPSKTYWAQGTIMGVLDLNDEAKVDDLCVSRNCMINVTVLTETSKPNDFKVKFVPQDSAFVDFKGMIVETVALYGWKDDTHGKPRAISAFLKSQDGAVSKVLVEDLRWILDNGVEFTFTSLTIQSGDELTISM